MKNNRRLCSVKNLPAKYPDANFTESSIRALIFSRSDNGFDYCVMRMGRKILIDQDRFEEWLDEQAYAAR